MSKIKNKWFILLALPLMVMLTGCNKFLDVQPKGTLPEGKQFEDVQGFRDAMYGVYASMAKPELYGQNLSFGFVDKLGQMLVNPSVETGDVEVRKYNYMHQSVRSTIDKIWGQQYKVISYLNLILEHIESTKLTHNDLQLIKGEALGLRAFLHFDLVRLYAEDYQRNQSAKGIPYSVSFDLNIKDRLTLQEVYGLIIKDLKAAEELLKGDNLLRYKDEVSMQEIYQSKRFVHFNKWAVKATLARVYYHMGNAEEAIKYAREVIANSGEMKLVNSNEMEKVRRFPAFGETIFGLNTSYLNDLVREMFLSTLGAGVASEGRRDLEKLYETSTFTATNTDKRYNLFYRKDGSSLHAFTRLLKDEEEAKSKPLTGIQLIRLPEMYYILAEMLYDSNKGDAVSALNMVRNSRGLENLKDEKVATKDAFLSELLHERMREMPGEGQVFYTLKLYNKPFTAFDGVEKIEPTDNLFVLPLPQKEQDFGNI